jgi:hypothetical protein
MGLRWLVLILLGTYIATFMKENHRFFSKHWFGFHVTLQTLGVLSSITGFLLILIYLKTFTVGFHQVFGWIILFLYSAQVILGTVAHFQYSPERKEVPVIDRTHKYVGIACLAFSWINCGTGLFILILPLVLSLWYFHLLLAIL